MIITHFDNVRVYQVVLKKQEQSNPGTSEKIVSTVSLVGDSQVVLNLNKNIIDKKNLIDICEQNLTENIFQNNSMNNLIENNNSNLIKMSLNIDQFLRIVPES